MAGQAAALTLWGETEILFYLLQRTLLRETKHGIVSQGQMWLEPMELKVSYKEFKAWLGIRPYATFKNSCVARKRAPADLTQACSTWHHLTLGRWGWWQRQHVRMCVIDGEHFSPVLMWSSVWYASGWRWAEGKGVSSHRRQKRAMRSSEPKAFLADHWQQLSSRLAFPGVHLRSHGELWY